MSNITPNYLASVKAAGAKNIQFSPTAERIPSKILIIGTGDPLTEAANSLNTPYQVFSPEEVGSRTGFGFMLHRLAVQAFRGGNGIETWIIQQPEPSGAQSAGSIDFAGTTTAPIFSNAATLVVPSTVATNLFRRSW